MTIRKKPLIDQELHLLYRYGLDKFKVMRDKMLPDHMTEYVELDDNEDNDDEYGN